MPRIRLHRPVRRRKGGGREIAPVDAALKALETVVYKDRRGVASLDKGVTLIFSPFYARARAQALLQPS